MSSLPSVSTAWPGLRALTTDMRAPALDLPVGLGQRSATYRFSLVNGVTGEVLGDLNPIREASLTHDTSSAIKRKLDLPLGAADTAAINALTDRVLVYMQIPSVPCPDTTSGDWPLGRYMWADESTAVSTGGRLGHEQLTDEMTRVDQQITAGISGVGKGIVSVILDVMDGLGVTVQAEASPFTSADAWAVGSQRGQMLETLSVAGDYFSPWFDNLGRLRFIRTFNPGKQAADINLDAGYGVAADSVLETSDILTAPNTIIVVSTNPSNSGSPCVGIASVPPTAPNSVTNRGFVIAETKNLQLSDAAQAQAVAEGLIERRATYRRINLTTPPDPRYDSYNVVRWQGENWLDLSWSLTLVEGAAMTHTMRRTYG